MLERLLPYAFNQFETCFIAFITDIQKKLRLIVPNLPVFILNNGDFSYFVNRKFVETKNEEVYMRVPRLVIRIEDIQFNQQEDTNQYNKIYYSFDLKDGRGPLNYCCVCRRKAYNIMISTNFVSSNFVSMLNHVEAIATLASRDNVFTYRFLGNTIQSAYTLIGMNNEIPSIDMGQGGTRNCTAINQMELQTHLIVPRIETIKSVDESGIEQTIFDITTGGYKNRDEVYGIQEQHEQVITPDADEETTDISGLNNYDESTNTINGSELAESNLVESTPWLPKHRAASVIDSETKEFIYGKDKTGKDAREQAGSMLFGLPDFENTKDPKYKADSVVPPYDKEPHGHIDIDRDSVVTKNQKENGKENSTKFDKQY